MILRCVVCKEEWNDSIYDRCPKCHPEHLMVRAQEELKKKVESLKKEEKEKPVSKRAKNGRFMRKEDN